MLEVNEISDGALLGLISLGPDGMLMTSSGVAAEIVDTWRGHGADDETIYNRILPGWSNGYIEIVHGQPDPGDDSKTVAMPPEQVDGDDMIGGLTKADEEPYARNDVGAVTGMGTGSALLSHAQVNYRPALGETEQCVNCDMYTGSGCLLVADPIYPDGVCKRWAPVTDVEKSDASDRDCANAVHAQLEPDFPPDAISWVRAAKWHGPVDVPLDQVDFSHKDGWRASHEPDKVAKFRKKIKANKPLKPVILVNEPNNDKMIVADGHHRSLAALQEGKPVRAFVAEVGTVKGPWDTMHAAQRQNPSNEK